MNLYDTGKKIIMKHKKLLAISSTIFNFIGLNKISSKGKNNKIKKANVFMKKCKIKVVGNNNNICIGEMSYLQNTSIVIYGNNNEVILKEKNYVNNGDFYLEDDNNQLKIGYRTTLAGNTHLALTEGKKITIGEKCLFSSNIVFRTGDSHSILDINGKRINYGQDINVENHVWITQNVTVLKGAAIPTDSVVATGSIVTRKFEKGNVLLAGNPAKIIKENINWNNIRI